MTIELGVAITPDGADAAHPAALAALARAAEAAGLDLIAIEHVDDGDTAALDPWTVAAWLAAHTERIGIGVPEHAVPEASAPQRTRGSAFGLTGGAPDAAQPVPSVVARARESLDTLAGPRIVVDRAAAPGWLVAPRDADRAAIAALAEARLPVLVPVATGADVSRVAALAREVRATEPARPRRSAAARARRVAGIDYDGVPESLAATAVEPGDPAHRSVASTYLRGGAPGLVLRPRTPDEVVEAVAFAQRHRDVPLGIRSAGHGISGRSTNRGGIVIDVGALDGIDVVDAERRIVRIGPGATWKRIAAALHPYGWALGSGDYGGVGVGGLATAGGIGLLSRGHGLTIDHLRAVELVLADGSRVRASDDERADLFWAVRGAGANFGIATSFEFEVDELGEVGWAKFAVVVPDLEQALFDLGRAASAAPRDTTAFVVTGAPRDGQGVLQFYVIVDSDDADVIIERLTPFAQLGAVVQQQVAVMPYRDVMAEAADVGADGQHGFGEPVSRSAFLPELTREAARDLAALLASGAVHFFQLRTMGGAIADVSPDAMAFSHRSAEFQATAMGSDDATLTRAWSRLRPHFDGLYLSFETDRSPERLLDAFPEPVLARLSELKRRYDPGNLFRDNFNIDPARGAGPATSATTDQEAAA